MNMSRCFPAKILAVVGFLSFACVSYANDISGKLDGTELITGTIKGNGIDRYSFQLSDKENFIAVLSETGEHHSGFLPQLRLIDSDNKIVDSGAQSFFFRMLGIDLAPGKWTIEVSRADEGESGGSYELNVIKISKAKGTPIKLGESYTGDITNGAVDIYTLTGTPDVTAQFTLAPKSGDGFIPEITTYAPNGDMYVGMACMEPCSFDLPMTEHGLYTVMVWRHDQGDGKRASYTLSASRPDTPDVAGVTKAEAELVSVESVFSNPIAPLRADKVAAPRRSGGIYIDGMFLLFSPSFPSSAEHAAAKKGNIDLQLYLGDHYYPNIQEAAAWWTKAAGQGEPGAYNRLSMIDIDHGTDKKYEVAAWYRLIVEQGSLDPLVARANQYLTGRGAGQDFAQALKLYHEAAERGSRIAQFNLAVLYSIGLGSAPDFAEAAKWYGKAAEQGLIVAMHNLAELYERGEGVARQDYAQAVKLYSKAAESGYPPAFYRLGRLAAQGHGGPKDEAQAITWFGKAAATGHADARAELDALEGRTAEAIQSWQKRAAFGNRRALQSLVEQYRKEGIPQGGEERVLRIYRQAADNNYPESFAGLGDFFAKRSSPDYPEAYFWYSLASSSSGDPYLSSAEKSLIVHYASAEADKIEKQLSPEQAAVARWRIKDRFPLHLTESQKAAATVYTRGLRAWRTGDYASALVFFLQADRHDIAKAQRGLGAAFEVGHGVLRDMNKSIEYYKKAIRNGDVGSATNIGNFYYFGIGVPRDINEATRWYEMDASRGFMPAIKILGWIYLREMPKGTEKAIAMYEKASSLDIVEANAALGMIYLYGVGIEKDHRKALEWYLKGADKYDPTSRIQASAILVKHEPRDYARALELISTIVTPVALNNMAYMYEHGMGVDAQSSTRPQPPPTALELYKRAADMCYGRAMYHIGRLIETGINAPAVSATPVEKNAASAREWMTLAAHHGSKAASVWLGLQVPGQKKGGAMPAEEITFPPAPCAQKE